MHNLQSQRHDPGPARGQSAVLTDRELKRDSSFIGNDVGIQLLKAKHTLVEKGAETTIIVLEYGAVDIMQKPAVGTKKFLEEARVLLIDAVRHVLEAMPLGQIAAHLVDDELHQAQLQNVREAGR